MQRVACSWAHIEWRDKLYGRFVMLTLIAIATMVFVAFGIFVLLQANHVA
jgi:hypothetical protein